MDELEPAQPSKELAQILGPTATEALVDVTERTTDEQLFDYAQKLWGSPDAEHRKEIKQPPSNANSLHRAGRLGPLQSVMIRKGDETIFANTHGFGAGGGNSAVLLVGSSSKARPTDVVTLTVIRQPDGKMAVEGIPREGFPPARARERAEEESRVIKKFEEFLGRL